jgi:hypothetical protein
LHWEIVGLRWIGSACIGLSHEIKGDHTPRPLLVHLFEGKARGGGQGSAHEPRFAEYFGLLTNHVSGVLWLWVPIGRLLEDSLLLLLLQGEEVGRRATGRGLQLLLLLPARDEHLRSGTRYLRLPVYTRRYRGIQYQEK